MQKRKILIVEDNVINRKILSAILVDNYSILEAPNGLKAIDILKNDNDVSAVLLDLFMPVMDGFEFLNIVKDSPIISNIPIIITSQYDYDCYELKALSMGAIDFLYKPYKSEIIKKKLANVINLKETAAMLNAIKNDALTGLSNKETFFKNVKDSIKFFPEKEQEIVCINIEKFKFINNMFGIATGDKVLCDFANKLNAICIEHNAFCSRINSDIFGALILKENYFTNNFYEKVQNIFKDYYLGVNIRTRIGVYKIDDLTISPIEMFDRAQIASDTIRNKYNVPLAYYDDELFRKMKHEKAICDSLDEALANKEYVPYYQPKIDLKTEKIVGAEALVRWIHPEKGIISPGNFIPILEKNGLISKLDFYLWERVFQDMYEWKNKGLQMIPISLNVSRVDLYSKNLISYLSYLLDTYHINPDNIHLEITETLYMEDLNFIIDRINEIKKLGLKIEMDDFGMGYSSLGVLCDIPIDLLKLDMSFFKNISEKTNKQNIIDFIIKLAKKLNLGVIAEGIETKDQIDFLKNVDCDYVQGFYYYKPLHKDDYEKKLFELNNK